MATHFGFHRRRTTAPWSRLDSRDYLHRRVRAVAITVCLALLVWTCWLALHQPPVPSP